MAKTLPMKILILGGYGAFGGRLAQLLAHDGLDLIIAGRDLGKATAFCAAHRIGRPLQADRATIVATLHQQRPDILVDASGPFQAYGADPYAVVLACIANGTHYLDFADGADFVAGIAAHDTAAKQAGIAALTGVSSFPVLTAAVLAEMSTTMTIRHVTGGIAPSPHAGVGPNVLRAVLGYAGEPVAMIRDGRAATGRGLAETRRYTVAPPGAQPLANTLFSLVDVPDLRTIPAAHPEIATLWMGAGPRPEPLHRLLITLARLRSLIPLPRLTPLAALAGFALNTLTYGPHRGGMFIEAVGHRDGHPVTRSWHMLAEGDDGPLIAAMALAVLILRAKAGQPPDPGARAALGALTLADYEAQFAARAITTGWREEKAGSIYEQVLGTAFATLPASLQALHRPGPRARWAGRATVTRSASRMANLVARIFAFPAAGADIPVSVTFLTAPDGRETWGRNFAGRLMLSTQQAGRGRNQHLITERFGPLAFGLAMVTDGNRLRVIPVRWSLLGLPLPRRAMPRGQSYETEVDGKFRFHVEIAVPLIGPVVTYDGWLAPQD